jgi:methylated-DNA-protein-cysteine methyltransferase-like protein
VRPPPQRELFYAVIRRVPPGRVTTFGWVARMAGSPGAARQVGWALAALEEEDQVPWWRVIQAGGTLPKHRSGPERQAELLRREGIPITAAGRVDLSRYGWEE